MMCRLLRYFLPVLFVFPTMAAQAQWSSSPSVNNAICQAGDNQVAPRIISDGKGGAIICWYDERAVANNFDVYAQRIDRDGFIRWTVNGVAISTAWNSQSQPELVTDGAGGAIITWTDNRNGDNDIYAQRVDSSGNVLWAVDGIIVASGPNNQADPKITTDGNGGAIITWNDGDGAFPPVSKIYAQRLDGSGALLWGTGALVSGTLRFSNAPSIASDGRGGAYIAYAYFPRPDYDVYAQRLDASGAVLWASRGVPIATGSSVQDSPVLASDGAGNAFLAYTDWGGGATPRLHLALLKPDGTTGFNARVTSTNADQNEPQLSPVGAGMLGIAWEDARSGGKKAFAQIYDTTGAKSWAADGIALSNRAGDQVAPTVIGDGSGGMIAAWSDKTAGSLQADIYAQRVSAAGALLWTDAGAPVGTAANIQQLPRMLPDGQHGAIAAWEDYRPSLTNVEIYASKILADGTFPIGPPVLAFSTKKLTYGSVVIGTTSSKTITLTNPGGSAVTIASTSSSDPHFTFLADNNTIAPGASVSATVRFSPTFKSTVNAFIVVTSNSALSPDTITVSGSGSGAAAIRVEPNSLNFGAVAIGGSRALALTITNSGNDSLIISSITSGSARFTVDITSKMLAAGEAFDDTVRFSPTAAGAVSTELTIVSNAATSPTTVRVSGSGASEVTITVAPDNISFGDVPVGGNRDTTVTLTNTGNADLSISSFTAADTRFTLETAVTDIPAGGSKTFTLRFSPDATGPVSSTFSIESNATSSPHSIAVDGSGVADPAIAVDPARLQFGEVDLGTSEDRTLSISNSGTLPLTVSAITSDNADFAAQESQFEVPGGGSHDVTVRFTPGAAGSRSGTLTIVSNAASSPTTVSVEGTGRDVSSVQRLQGVPGAFTLYQNYPNPFQPSTTIRYDLEVSAQVRVTVMNALGQVMTTLVDERQQPGVHDVRWVPADSAPGVYFYIVRVGGYEAFGTMVLMK